MKTVKTRFQKVQLMIAAALLVGFNVVVAPLLAHASTMTNASVMLYNMNASGSGQVAFVFKAGASLGAGSLTLNFGSWGGTVNATQTISTAGCQALTGATNVLPGAITASGSGQVVTVASVGATTAGQSYCAILTSATAVTNPAATGVYPVVITNGGTDTVTTAVNVITNDQVVVNATVPPTFTMSLSSNTDNLGTLSASALTTSTGINATVSTNGNYGWFLWALDSQAGLRSTSQSKTIASVPTGSNQVMNGGSIGTEKYALGVTTANATANYANAGGVTGGGLSTTTYNQIAGGNAAVAGAVVNIKELANISATTPAATDYSDTITLVGAGSF